MAMRPAWVDQELFPFESRFLEVEGARVHYVDEGQGPVFLALHGNPTWSFLYRHIIAGLKDRFRCLVLDYPGFGLSTAPPGYRYTVAEHSKVVEGFVTQLGLDGITLMGRTGAAPSDCRWRSATPVHPRARPRRDQAQEASQSREGHVPLSAPDTPLTDPGARAA